MIKKLTKAILIYGLGSSLSKFISIFLAPIYTRLFSPKDYGSIDLITSINAIVCIISMLQLESAVARFYYEKKDILDKQKLISTAMWTIIGSSLFITILTIIFSKLISELFFENDQFYFIIIISSFSIILTNLFSFCSIIIRFENKPIFFSIMSFIQLATSASITLLLVIKFHMSIIGVFYGQLSGLIISTLIMIYYLKKIFRFYWSPHILSEMLKYSLPTLPAVGINWLNSYGNRFVMVAYLSIADIGLFSIALKIASVIKLFENAFKMAWYPFFWETFTNPNHKEIYKKLFKQISLISFALVAIISLFADEIIRIITPQSYWSASKLIGILSLSMGLTIICQIIGVGPDITKKTFYNTIFYAISTIINLVSLFILVPSIKLIGVPIALFLSSLFLIIIFWYKSEKLYYIGFSKSFFIKSLIIILGMVIAFSILKIFLVIKILIILLLSLFLLLNQKKFGFNFFII